MEKLLRKLRGLAGVAVTWGGAWGLIGAGIGGVIAVVTNAWDWMVPVTEWALGMGLYGAVSGAGFSILLSLREARSTLASLSLRRTAVWGVLGSAAVPLVFGLLGTFEAGTTALDVLGAMGVTAGLGGLFAPGSVALARRALPPGGEGPQAISPLPSAPDSGRDLAPGSR